MVEKKIAFLATLKVGKLHAYYGIDADEKIPKALLRKTVTAAKHPGSKFVNPTKVGKKNLTVPKTKDASDKLEREARFPLIASGWKKK